MKSLFVLALLLYFSAASALKCYECSSQTSMSDCESSKKETECSAGEDRCGKASAEYKVASVETKTYAKGCSTEALCDYGGDVFKSCKKVDGATCKWDCCSGNLCNGGTAPEVSSGTAPVVSRGTTPVGNGGTAPEVSSGTAPVVSRGTAPVGNGGTAPVVNVFLVVAGALVALFR